MDSINLDDVEFDWAFYRTPTACKKGTGERKVPKSDKQVCKQGSKGGLIGFWRYPADNFPNGSYPLKNGGTRTHTSIKQFKDKRHTSDANAKRRKAIRTDIKKGLNFFKGYATKKKKSSGGKKTCATDVM